MDKQSRGGRGKRRGRSRVLRGGFRQVRRGARNMLDILRHGRLGAPYRAPFEVIRRGKAHALRRYHAPNAAKPPTSGRPVALLVPPLMVTSEIYDISPELSAVSCLLEHGFDVWVVDYGAPEEIEGGMERDLDDHILAVVDSVRDVVNETGQEVHLMGYSQGGLFAYQAAAYLRSEGLASIITFGSPVDLRRSFPIPIHDEIAGRILNAAGTALSKPLEAIDGLPGALTSNGFKVLNVGKEFKQIVGFFGLLHDRSALEQREPKRRFLGGEGFVSWPGPALRQFMEEVVTHNRLARGGLVVAGKTVSLADIHCPILYFVGARDDMARPPAVRSIRTWATSARHIEREVQCGHFGLVVGSKAMNIVWPTVIDWIEWVERGSAADPEAEFVPGVEQEAPLEHVGNIGPLYEVATDLLDGIWQRLGEVSLDVAEVLDTIRWQIPRVAQILEIKPDSRVNAARLLREQARAIGETPFLIWRDRAFTYAQADAEVDAIAAALHARGVRRGAHVGVLIEAAPAVLTVSVALNRLGAIAVLLDSARHALTDGDLEGAIERARVERVVSDIEEISARLHGVLPVMALEELVGADAKRFREHTTIALDGGLASEVGMIVFGEDDTLPILITNRRWSVAALGAAAGARLTSFDTVYCPVSCSTALGMLVAASGALAGGARLALSDSVSSPGLLEEVRRYGASVLFYERDVLEDLIAALEREGSARKLPLRAVIGMGARGSAREALTRLLPHVDVLEFFAQPEGPVCLATLTHDAPGAMGRELPGMEGVSVVRFDREARAPALDASGRAIACEEDTPGLLVGRVEEDHPLFHYDGYLDPVASEERLLHNLFEPGDLFYDTRVLARRDATGAYWFEGRA